MKLRFLIGGAFAFITVDTFGQGCCSGGGTNPLAGGNATGLLKPGQAEWVVSHSFSQTSTFYTGTHKTDPYFEKTKSSYKFTRLDYGVTDKLNISAALGYYSARKIYQFKNEQLGEQRIIQSKGWGDLILMPRFQLYRNEKPSKSHEIDVGLGLKIPLGISNDSNFVGYAKFLNTSGSTPFIDSTAIWHTSPPLIQTTTGSMDLISSLLYLHNNRGINYVVNLLYMYRGWNPLGIKFGDYLTLGVFAGKRWGDFHVMGQLKAEWFGKMKTFEKIDYLAVYNIDKSSTGTRALFFSPQISYNKNAFRMYVLGDIPLLQSVNGTQTALPGQITLGMGYRFDGRKVEPCSDNATLNVNTVLKPGKFEINVGGACGMCQERIEKTALSLHGISKAQWSLETGVLTVEVSENFILEDLHKALAGVGHDTDLLKAENKVYQALPSCCHYRKK